MMTAVRSDLPSGTVTLLFTDIEGSTKLLHELGADAYAEALADHRRVLRDVFANHGGVEVDTQGDAFFYAFPDAHEAVVAAADGREALRPGLIQIRVGIHTGTPHVGPEGYVGEDVHLGARIGAAGHGGQVLLSDATSRAAGLDGAALLDLGEHRLKDFDRPIPIFQLGGERFPPLKTISNTNLPRPASSFIGREDEVVAVTTLIRDGARLVTLTGPGGSGKTRLSIEAAAELVGDHRAGTFWVELAPIRDAALVIDEVAKTLGARDGLADHIGEREMLLLLDNLEQVIDAAPAIADLVENCPNLAVLATTRERLRVRGEVEFEVRPLAESDAVELFVARAGLSGPDDAVAELCRALDEMPLAIELAAARAKVLAPDAILARLSRRLDLFTGGRDADPRQRTLRSTIEWSHDLIDPEEEQRLFARLAVFAGGATFEAAEQVADADLDTLGSLVEKSLVRRTDDRYWMYETIREFALERLEASGEAREIGRRHAEHFLELAEAAEPHLRNEEEEWLDRLETERDNVRAALDHLEAAAKHDLTLRTCAAYWWVWSLRGPLRDGLRRVERALAGDPRPTVARAYALTGASDMAGDAGDHVTARAWSEEALALHRALGSKWGVAYAQLGLGLGFAFEDRFAEARPLFDDAVRGFRELGDEHWELQASLRLAWAHEELGDLRRAREIQAENLSRARASGDALIEAKSLAVLAQYHLDEGRVEPAIPLLVEAHSIHRGRRGVPDEYWMTKLVCRFAHALALKGEDAAAILLLACAEVRFEELEIDEGTFERWLVRMNEQTREMVSSSIDETSGSLAVEEGRKLTVDEAVALALEALR